MMNRKGDLYGCGSGCWPQTEMVPIDTNSKQIEIGTVRLNNLRGFISVSAPWHRPVVYRMMPQCQSHPRAPIPRTTRTEGQNENHSCAPGIADLAWLRHGRHLR